MNTPPTIRRYTPSEVGEGSWDKGCTNPTICGLLGTMVAIWPSVEATMIVTFIQLAGINSILTGSVILNGIFSAGARVALMKNLLEKTERNVNASTWYDEYLTRLGVLISKRNKYIHGTWYTDTHTGSVWLAPTDGYAFDDLDRRREVTETELIDFIKDAVEFTKWARLKQDIENAAIQQPASAVLQK